MSLHGNIYKTAPDMYADMFGMVARWRRSRGLWREARESSSRIDSGAAFSMRYSLRGCRSAQRGGKSTTPITGTTTAVSPLMTSSSLSASASASASTSTSASTSASAVSLSETVHSRCDLHRIYAQELYSTTILFAQA